MIRVALPCLACLALVSVLIANQGAPLFYYDTAAYIAQGEAALRTLGLLPTPEIAESGPATEYESPPGVVGSRSLIYGLLLAGIGAVLGFTAALTPQLIVFLAATTLLARRLDPALIQSRPLSLVILAGCLGSLPFYAAYLMPDLLAPALILAMAALLLDDRRLTPVEAVLCVLIGVAAAVTHLTHLGLVAGFLILGLIGALLRLVPWSRPLLIALILGTGLAERVAFTVATETVMQRDVVYTPFLTARLIADGPGQRYLGNICAGPSRATEPACPFHDRVLETGLSPITPSRLLFLRAPETATFRALPSPAQKAIASDQVAFAGRVLAADPLGVLGAVLGNTGEQLMHYSIWQTLPRPEMQVLFLQRPEGIPPVFAELSLDHQSPWRGRIDLAHSAVYGIALLAGLAALILPGTPPRARRAALLIGLGLIGNAALCGAVSEPASRYGARVIFLLPMLALWMWMLRRSNI